MPKQKTKLQPLGSDRELGPFLMRELQHRDPLSLIPTMSSPSDSKEVAELRHKIRNDWQNTDLYNDLGVLLMKDGRAHEAYGVLREAVKVNPTDSALLCNLGIALKETDRADAAKAAFMRAIRLSPDVAAYHVCAANICFSEQKFDEGIEILDRFLGGKYDDPGIRINLALAYKGKKLYGLAIDQLEIAMQLTSDPNEEELVKLNRHAKKLIKEIKALRYMEAPDTKASIKQVVKKAMEQ